jgi:hypothetical protein
MSTPTKQAFMSPHPQSPANSAYITMIAQMPITDDSRANNATIRLRNGQERDEVEAIKPTPTPEKPSIITIVKNLLALLQKVVYSITHLLKISPSVVAAIATAMQRLSTTTSSSISTFS